MLQTAGSLAEYAVAATKLTAKRPERVSAIDGASLGVAGQTALQSVRDSAGIKLDGSSAGKNILITAASGGVGTYAIQVRNPTLRRRIRRLGNYLIDVWVWCLGDVNNYRILVCLIF